MLIDVDRHVDRVDRTCCLVLIVKNDPGFVVMLIVDIRDFLC